MVPINNIKNRVKKKTLVLDVASIKNLSASFFLNTEKWPVSEKLFWKLANFLYEKYIDQVKLLKGKDYNIAVIELSFINLLINILHYNYIKNIAKTKKYELLYSDSSTSFLQPNWKNIANFYSKPHLSENKLKKKIKQFIKVIYFNKHLDILKIISNLFKQKKNISIGSFDINKKDYINKTNQFFFHVDWKDLINRSATNSVTEQEYKKYDKYNLIKIVINSLKRNKDLNFFLKGLNENKIIQASQQRINSINLLYERLLKSKLPYQILVTQSGNPFHKIISSAFLEKKIKVINFSHGNDLGIINQKWAQTYLCALTGNYGYETKNICSAFKSSSLKLPLAKKEKQNFFSINNNLGLKRSNIYFSKLRTKRIKKVMVMGYPMNSNRYTGDSCCFFHYKLKLEIHTLRALKQAGYYTIYKTHPDRLMEVGNIFKKEADECIGKKFEKVWKKADALIFTYITTSAFGFALTTPLPILILDNKYTDWQIKRKNLLEQRVELLMSNYDSKNSNINSIKIRKSLNASRKKIASSKIKGLI